MILRSFTFLITLLIMVPMVWAGQVDYLAKKRQLHYRWEKVMKRYPIGSPERTAAFKRYVIDPLGQMDSGRIGDFKKVCADANVLYSKKLFSAGSTPWDKAFKPGGDLDLQPSSTQGYYRLQDAFRKRGFKVTENGNSFTVGSHEITVHLPPSCYSNPTSAGGRLGAIKNDVEAAEGIALSGGTNVPHPKGTVHVSRSLIRTPVVDAGDYYKKAHHGRHLLQGNNINRADVLESLNFSNKANYKMAKALRDAGIDPGMAIHRKNSYDLEAQLGNRTGAEAKAFAKRVNNQTFQRLQKMAGKAAKETAKDVAKVRQQIRLAEKAKDYRRVIALRQQLNTTRHQVKRLAEMSGRKELVRQVMSGADDTADAAASGRGAKFLKKMSKNLKKVTPALKKLGGMVVKGLSYAARAAQLYALSKEYDAAVKRETEWAEKIGRDPSTGGITKEFIFGALGFYSAMEKSKKELAKQGKNSEDILSWDFLKTFVSVEISQVIDAAYPLAQLNPSTRILQYLVDNPDFAKKMIGQEINFPVGPDLVLPVKVAPPPMVAASLHKDEAKPTKEKEPEMPPMIAALFKKDGKDSNATKDKEEKPPPMVAKSLEKKIKKPKQKSKSKPEPEKEYAVFDPRLKYTVKGIALDLEPRVCRTGTSSSETFNGLVHGSEVSIIVHQNGEDYVLSGSMAKRILTDKGYIRIQHKCGYVTTKLYKSFGPGITQGGNEGAEQGPKKSFNECIEQYCPGCSQSQILGVAGINSECEPCLDANRSLINACYQ